MEAKVLGQMLMKLSPMMRNLSPTKSIPQTALVFPRE